MTVFSGTMPLPVLLAVILSAAMTLVAALTWVYHDSKHRDLDSWVEFGFSGETLRHALVYYRSMFIFMLMFYVLFAASCLFLQADGYRLFSDGRKPVTASLGGVALFALDLVLRGGFFDIMEHFDLHATVLFMNRDAPWFVLYCFVFRMYYGLTLIRLAVSFAWIWAKIHAARNKETLAADVAVRENSAGKV